MARRLNASLVDWNDLTIGKCNHTLDGRHYDKIIVGAQLRQLRGLLGARDEV